MNESAARKSATSRETRSLQNLQDQASTSRMLNLIAVWRRSSGDADYRRNPMFIHPVLNRSIIVKHRLRQNERDAFTDGRTEATKVILPIDITDMRVGARAFFIDQVGYESALNELFGSAERDKARDRSLLSLIETLPSLDPFLMRERIKESGFDPARCYFDITEGDAARMFQFVRQEVSPLIGLSFDDVDVLTNDKTAKLAAKLLANDGDAEMEPLRQGLGMDEASFKEGIFCWKGFIYYKWSLKNLIPTVRPVADEISNIRPSGPILDDDKAFVLASRRRIASAISRSCETVRMTLKVYDDAYADLTRNEKPQAFREFLLKAPSMFRDLGGRLGGVQHIISFWRYRFPEGAQPKIGGDELVELLADFECSINIR